MSREYEPVIGMEVHVQLATDTKMFCACPTSFGDPPNTNTCPVCLGLPGSLPRVNRTAVVLGVMAARALSCIVSPIAQFARKNYYYPDLPKGYQISMYEFPIGTNGALQLLTEQGELTKGIGIERCHLEEDTGKLFHEESVGSLIDFNRAGIPLLEIVSKPEMRSGSTAVRYLKELRRVIRFYGISNANMEEGSFRCEVNISLRPVGTEDFGTKVEIKNLNSFRAVERSIDYEIKRQTEILNKREIVRHETRGWDDKEGVTVHQRFKERAPEYRYFPEPDLPDLHLTDTISEEALIDLEELPVRQVRGLIERFGVPPQSAELLMSGIGAPVEDPYYVGEFFEKCIDRHGGHGTLAVNLITGIIFEHLNKENTTLDQTVLTPKKLAEVTKMVARDEVSSTNAKLIVARILKEGGDVREIVVDEGLVQVSDEDELVTLVREVIEENESIVEEIKRGKINAIGSLVGTAMKKSDGQANPKRVNELLHEILLPKKHK